MTTPRHRILRFSHGEGTYPVFLHVPPAREGSRALVLFLHGAGERGRDGSRLAQVALPRVVARDPGFPHVLLAPQCPPASHWGEQEAFLDALLAETIPALAVDPDRVHVTGISMGAAGAWAFVAGAPERFASLVSVCAPRPRGEGWPARAARLRDVPVLAYHGGADDEVLPWESVALVEAHRRAGGAGSLTIYADLGHFCWDRAYAEPAVRDLWARRRR